LIGRFANFARLASIDIAMGSGPAAATGSETIRQTIAVHSSAINDLDMRASS
jgi:hypothetical protein